VNVPIPSGPFQLPIHLDLAASFFCAASGALAALRKRYDLVGIVVLSYVTGLGGALLRDGLFLQAFPSPVLQDWRYLGAVLAGAAAAAFFARQLHRLRIPFLVADALALGLYAVVGAQKALAAGLPALTAALVGLVNAVGGGILRDVLVREEPLIFRPGEFYALAAMAGCAAFLLLSVPLHVPPIAAAIVGVAVACAARLLSVALGWRTGAMWEDEAGPPPR
jgi:uncharacterized membrane protein YeiH